MIFIVIVHVFVSLVLILVILLQAGKGGGLSESFGGASQQLFGTKSSTFLNRATSVCAILFLVTCILLGVLSKKTGRSLMESVSPGQAPVRVAEPAQATEAAPTTSQGLDEKRPQENTQTPFGP
ncbi:MAG: preprotein translocase subunit SecG [Candidatus Omnitrophota bacterium]